MGRKRPPRATGFDYIGLHVYFLTICCESRAPTFIHAIDVEGARTQFLQTGADYGFDIAAYCFMPDHVHGLIEGLRLDADFCRFVSMFKQRSAFEFNNATNSACGRRATTTTCCEMTRRRLEWPRTSFTIPYEAASAPRFPNIRTWVRSVIRFRN